MLLFCILSILTSSASADECRHTNVFLARGGNNNTNNWYFVPVTYSSQGQCITFSRNDEVRRTVSRIWACGGEWCRSGSRWPNNWNCPRGRECYEVEHIIPKRNNITALNGCNTNIYGNMVMTYGKWNSAVLDRYLPEKKLVYGHIFDSAYRAVYRCCKGVQPTIIPAYSCAS